MSAGARTIIDANLYMTLGTADETGRPWASPVYFARADRDRRRRVHVGHRRATASEHWVLDDRDYRQPVSP